MIQNNSLILSNEELDSFISILTEYSGIIPRSSHRDGIKMYLETKILEKKVSVADYKSLILTKGSDFIDFINECTVNETYFFREEKQFLLLKNRFFPLWKLSYPSSEMKIWSAACSYGEEAYSLAFLAKLCGVKPMVTASDINSRVLEHCKRGVFLGTSLRSVDGVTLSEYLHQFKRGDGKIEFPKEIRDCIQTEKINLSELSRNGSCLQLPRNQNLVFLRNVFIYFDRDLRAVILRNIAEKCLAQGGLLFVSMSEIAQIDEKIIPQSLEKVVEGDVFYFIKRGDSVNGKSFS